MLKKIILIILLSIPVTANAGFWDALGACFADPCNCGDSNPTRWEDWNGQHLNKGKKNRVCPPWNKTGGRGAHTCLLQSKLPQPFTPYYSFLCAEETPESNYFKPKIRVRGQQCNIVACWTSKDSLAWDGRCVTLAGGYGLPLIRMCARIAIPANYAANFPEDPGYTTGVHLNFEGATVDDEPVLGYDGQPIVFNPPKLCLYQDPAFLSFKNGLDLMDLDPNKMPYHKTKELHPVIKVIIFFFKMAMEVATSPMQMISSLFTMMGGGPDSGFGKIIGELFKFLDWLIKLVGTIIIEILKAIGQINRAVDDTIYGCVKLPMGPYPPPFCPVVAPFFETAYTQKICRKGDDGAPLPSIEDEPCVVSTLENNFVRNSVRVTFENFVPLCKNGEDPLLTDKCVTLDNLGVFGSATGIHASTGKTDIIPACVGAPSGSLCVKTKIPHNCSVTANGCQDGFRIVYGLRIGSSSTPQSYYKDDSDDCPNNDSIDCQEIWGVNTSEFVDTSLAFPAIEDISDIAPLTKTISLKDKAGRYASFLVSIVRVSSYDPVLQETQEPKQICVAQGDTVVGCEDRAPVPKPKVYDCNDSLAPISCTSSYFAPKLVATIKDRSDSTSAVVEPLSVYNMNNSSAGIVNLGGYNFDSFVTDDSFVKKPFSGPKSPNPGSLFGTYQNNDSPLKSDLTENPDAVYITGLEYINDYYYVGGKYACLENVDVEKCPTNVKNCVLSNLDNANIVSCSDFLGKLAVYPNLALCTSAQSSSCTTIVDSLTGGVSIRSCGANSGIYCYTSPGSTEVCKITSDPTRRYIPSPSLGATLSDSQYFDIENISPGYAYDQNLYFLRDKSPYEMSLCTNIPLPSCSPTYDYNQDSGYASWPATPAGQMGTGTCQPGKNPVGSLQRRCVPDANTRTFKFEPLYSWDRSGSSPVKVYSNVKCQ